MIYFDISSAIEFDQCNSTSVTCGLTLPTGAPKWVACNLCAVFSLHSRSFMMSDKSESAPPSGASDWFEAPVQGGPSRDPESVHGLQGSTAPVARASQGPTCSTSGSLPSHPPGQSVPPRIKERVLRGVC